MRKHAFAGQNTQHIKLPKSHLKLSETTLGNSTQVAASKGEICKHAFAGLLVEIHLCIDDLDYVRSNFN